jgi:hypothetical protein
MTDDEKLERMIKFLTESHLDVFGGYPYDCVWIGDTLVVASLDDFKERHRTQIEKYDRKKLIDWHDRAVEFVEEEGETMRTALWETEQKGG